jgi:hypothetical protein
MCPPSLLLTATVKKSRLLKWKRDKDLRYGKRTQGLGKRKCERSLIIKV